MKLIIWLVILQLLGLPFNQVALDHVSVSWEFGPFVQDFEVNDQLIVYTKGPDSNSKIKLVDPSNGLLKATFPATDYSKDVDEIIKMYHSADHFIYHNKL